MTKKTNKQLQAEIDKNTIEINNLTDTVEILEKGTRQIAKILGLDGIAETTYFNDADFECIEKAIEKLQGKYEKCFEELSMKCGECEGLVKANETIVKAHNELELDKKDLHKRLIEGLQINIEKVEKIGELENEIKFLKTRLEDVETDENTKLLLAENEVIKQDKANLLAELTRQINEKSALRKENKRLKKRRREGRYNPKKVYEKLARGWLCYIPEGDYLPTKVHESLIDAMEEGHRLADKTGNQVYIVGTYCKI